jgi:hypothetical protein
MSRRGCEQEKLLKLPSVKAIAVGYEPLVPNCDSATKSMTLVLRIILWYGVQALVERTTGRSTPTGLLRTVIALDYFRCKTAVRWENYP